MTDHKRDLAILYDLSRTADVHYSHRDGDPEHQELADAIEDAHNALQIVNTLICTINAQRKANEFSKAFRGQTDLVNEMREMLKKQRALQRGETV